MVDALRTKAFVTLIEASPDCVYVKDRASRFVIANEATARFFGAPSPDALVGKTDFDFLPPDVAKTLYEIEQRVMAQGASFSGEEHGALPGRPVVWVSSTKVPYRDETGRVVGLIGIGRDITKEKRLFEMHREGERRYRMLYERTPALLHSIDAGGRLISVSDKWLRVMGYTRDEVLGRSPTDFLTPQSRESAVAVWLPRLRELGSVENVKYQFVKKSGEIMDVLLSAEVEYDANGRFVRTLAVLTDITDRMRAEKDLRLRDRALESTTSGVAITEAGGDMPIVYVNAGFTKLTGYAAEEAIGRNCRFLQGEDTDRAEIRRLRAAIADGRPCRVLLKNYRNDGAAFWNEMSVSPIRSDDGAITHYVASMDDVTDRVETEEHLRQSQKMEALGQLTGGVAHDFNNLLAAALANLELLEAREHGARDKVLIDRALRAIKGGAQLTRRLLAYSRQAPLSPGIVDVNREILGLEDMLTRTLGETIKLETVLSGGLWAAYVDAHQFETALLNLVLNARDAMPRGGRLTIETANVRLDDDYAEIRGFEVTPGRYVMAAVSDTGEGMSAETRARAFDPFFTTKEAGRGTGLGLSMVYGFLKQSGGNARIYSEEGQGTTIKLYLPEAPSDQQQGARPAETTPEIMAYRASAPPETVLVVEDDADLRVAVAEQLKQLGYDVLTAATGTRALGILATDVKIDILVSDIVLPCGIHGPKILAEARKRRKGLKAIFISGYPNAASINGNGIKPSDVQLTKPVDRLDLARKVRAVLDRKV